MIRQCSWCKRIMGERPPYSDKSVTHGGCNACMKKMLEDAGYKVPKSMLKKRKKK